MTSPISHLHPSQPLSGPAPRPWIAEQYSSSSPVRSSSPTPSPLEPTVPCRSRQQLPICAYYCGWDSLEADRIPTPMILDLDRKAEIIPCRPHGDVEQRYGLCVGSSQLQHPCSSGLIGDRRGTHHAIQIPALDEHENVVAEDQSQFLAGFRFRHDALFE